MDLLAQTFSKGARGLRNLVHLLRRPPVVEVPTPPMMPDISAFAHYADRARAAGLERLYLFLSFDCDTDRDADAAHDVHDFLDKLGIAMTLAVPGATLSDHAESYRKLAHRGIEFLNHGQRHHAAWQGDRYVPITFYEKMAEADVESDIRAGHATVTQVTGRTPVGFRAPHFGCFQEPHQLATIYRVVKSLGYRYCTTTMPQSGLERGPLYAVDGIVEVPTFGSVAAPTTLLDSWTYLSDRRNYCLTDAYADLMIETVDMFTRAGVPGILCWYADPSHVIGQAAFIRAMEGLKQRSVPSLTGSQCALLARRLMG